MSKCVDIYVGQSGPDFGWCDFHSAESAAVREMTTQTVGESISSCWEPPRCGIRLKMTIATGTSSALPVLVELVDFSHSPARSGSEILAEKDEAFWESRSFILPSITALIRKTFKLKTSGSPLYS